MLFPSVQLIDNNYCNKDKLINKVNKWTEGEVSSFRSFPVSSRLGIFFCSWLVSYSEKIELDLNCLRKWKEIFSQITDYNGT